MFRLLKTKFTVGTLPIVMMIATLGYTHSSNAQDHDAFRNGIRDGQAGGQYPHNARHYYDQDGYDQYGYGRDGYNQYGYNPSGYNRNGQRQNYQRNQYGQNAYDRNGNNQSGYDRNGRDRNGNGQGDNRYGNQNYPVQPDRGGIGPGKGAMIGGAGGAILGALFGGGLKGTLIGGAAGAGIGAVVGKEHQNSERQRYGGYPPQ